MIINIIQLIININIANWNRKGIKTNILNNTGLKDFKQSYDESFKNLNNKVDINNKEYMKLFEDFKSTIVKKLTEINIDINVLNNDITEINTKLNERKSFRVPKFDNKKIVTKHKNKGADNDIDKFQNN